MANELQALTEEWFKAMRFLLVIHVLCTALCNLFIILCILYAISSPRESGNRNSINISPQRTFDDNVHDVLKAQGQVR